MTRVPLQTPARLAAAIGGLALILAGVIPTALAAGTPLYPNLKVLPPRDLQLDRTDVSVDGSGQIDNVLRFSNTVYNAGEGPLELNGNIDPGTLQGPAIQRVYDTSGGYTDYTVGLFYYHAIHNHYHFDDWGQYQLWTKADYDKWIASGRTQGQAKKVGTKTTSCVLDEEFTQSLPATPWPGQYVSAGCQPDASWHLHMGLSPGWGDTYDYYRYEQWIDLGQDALSDGDWVLRSVADPNNVIYESPGRGDASREGTADNEAITVFHVTGGKLVDSNPPSGTVSVNHVDASTASPNVTVQVLGRDDISGVSQFRLSDDGLTWATYPYAAPGPSTAEDVAWSLNDARYGGTPATGTRTVYAQFQDKAGTWSTSFTDTINLAPLTAYAGAVAADSPAGYWRLGEASGVSAQDATGQNPGTYEGAPGLGAASLLDTDPGNTAVGFDGVNDDVLVPSSASLGFTNGLSLEAWIKPAALPVAGAFASIASKAESYSLQFNGPRLEFTVIQNGTRRRLQAPAGAVAAGSRYHVVATYDGTTQRLYLNGTLAASAALTGAATVTANPLRIGSWNGAKEFFRGTIDDVAAYGSVLSAARVSAHYTAGTGTGTPTPTPTATPGPTPTPSPSAPPSAWAGAVAADSPVSWWRLDETEGTAIHDAMGVNSGAIWNSPLMGQPSLLASDADPAFRFNGTSQYLAVPSSASLSFGSTFSLEAWIRPEALPAAGAFASVVTKAESYSLQFNGPRLEFTVMQGGIRRRLQAPTGAVVAGTAYHVVGTYDGAAQRLYLNGTQVASVALTGPASTSTNGLRIASWNGSKEFFRGSVDEVAVYSTVLSASRVAAHWSAAGGAAAAPAQSAAPVLVTPAPSKGGQGSGNGGTATPAPSVIATGAPASPSATATPTSAPTTAPTATPGATAVPPTPAGSPPPPGPSPSPVAATPAESPALSPP